MSATDDLMTTAFARHQAGDLGEAETLYRRILADDPDHINALQLLGALTVASGHAREALDLLERAVEQAARHGHRPQHSMLYNNLGNAHAALGNRESAIAAYRGSLALAPGNADVQINLAGELLATGQVDEAVAQYQDVLAADPVNVLALERLADIEWKRHKPLAAIVLFERLQKAAPDHAESHRALGTALRSVGRFDDAIEAFRRYLARLPNSATACLYLGTTLSEVGRIAESIPYLEKAVELEPGSAIAHIELGNALIRVPDMAAAERSFLRATDLQQTITRKVSHPRFSALFVLAPGVANTPYDFLVGRTDYDAHFLWYLPSGRYDVATLRDQSDIVVNLISDADQGAAVLPAAGAFMESLGRPIANHPAKILQTDRVLIARLLAKIPNCRVARVARFSGAALTAETLPENAKIFAPPFLARVAGLHGGQAFEKIDSTARLRGFVAQRPQADYYLMDYLDCRSADGYFRKYRFFAIGGEILPYHLAISEHWKVHHFRTDMAAHAGMQREEEAFLEAPHVVFGPAQMAALRAIGAAIGLDFCGIDCALDVAGNVVVFEANAAMLVQGQNVKFPYKDRTVAFIKRAFDAMLAAKAAQ